MEIWKDIKGYEGLYQVSNEGRVKSLGKEIVTRNKFGTCIKKLKEKILAQTPNKYGYQKVGLTENIIKVSNGHIQKKRTSTSVLFFHYLFLHPQQESLTLLGK